MFKRLRYEHWPFWVFYFPFVPFWLYWSFRARSFTYFAAVNPGIEWGGFFDYSKSNLLEYIPLQFKPKQFLIHDENQLEPPFAYPFILKPDIGERGIGVEKVYNKKEFLDYLKQAVYPIIAQEFIEKPQEAGLFYIRKPWEEKGKIISITGKLFLEMKGDGKTSIREFILTNPRALGRKEYLFNKFKDRLEHVLPQGESLILEEIGNHNRGTEFTHRTELYSKNLEDQLNEILNKIPGFFYGRLDLKFNTNEALSKGEFTILEINGANSEPTHIYCSSFNLFKAYKEVYKHLSFQYSIAKYNMKSGVQTPPFRDFLRIIFARYLKF